MIFGNVFKNSLILNFSLNCSRKLNKRYVDESREISLIRSKEKWRLKFDIFLSREISLLGEKKKEENDRPLEMSLERAMASNDRDRNGGRFSSNRVAGYTHSAQRSKRWLVFDAR